MNTCSRRFTLVELLVVMAIIAVLAGLLLPALAGVRDKAHATRARAEMKALQTAISMYESDYGYLPMPPPSPAADILLSDAQYTALIQTLQNVAPCGNARGKRYLDVSTKQGPGVFNDPWGQPYKVFLDLDYDGDIEANLDATYGPYEKVYGRVAVFSLGKDAVSNKGDKGDINSWRE
jgi:prepilin-type N-terminal cleavage/methylation domain-containing protein